ncbi:translation initiation factor IF-3 [Candidatus Roizmanbacteria bacterium]|nr:translation initiation factor IF-3 [Candidatus Roizmanbacteria bacterium]
MGNFNKPRFRRGKGGFQRKFYTINYKITAPQLRVVDAEGKQIGVMTREEALQKTEDEAQDLILIAPRATPPVAKLIDFKKFLYQEQKKEKEARKGIKKSIVKDIKLSLFIAPADFDRLIEKGKEFLHDGNQVRVNLALKGREMVKRDMGIRLVWKFIQNMGEVNVSKEPRLEGRVIRAVIARKK